jgi:hypothetical protein
MPKTTPAQTFASIFALFTAGATPGEREAAERKMDAWLKRHGKTRADIQSILVQAAADDAARQPPPPSDPRDAQKSSFDDPRFTPAGLVEHVVTKYVTMSEPVAVISSLWTCFTHVYTQFAVAPRIALVSEVHRSGKSTLRKVLKHLVLRPNRAVLSSGAAIVRFLGRGPGTVMIDETDHLDKQTMRAMQKIWNVGYEREAEFSLVIGGEEKFFNVYAPMLASGIRGFSAGMTNFLADTQKSRAFTLEMAPYTSETKPERDYLVDLDVAELNALYSYLHHWSTKVKLDPKPSLPSELVLRYGDTARCLVSIAASCGPKWERRACEALMFLFEREQAERPEIVLIRHGLAIFDQLEIDAIRATRFHQELKRLDQPDARWTRYRGPSGMETAHPITPGERVTLAEMVGIMVKKCKPPNEKQFRGYTYAQFEEAHRIHCAPGGAGPAAPRLRLITPTSE